MENFNKLIPAQTERLAYLAEECGEVIQIVGKILRHGYDSYNPYDPNKESNKTLLETELNDILKAISRLKDNNDIHILVELKAYKNNAHWHHQEK